MYDMVTSIEFWISFTINYFIVELLKFKPMDIKKSIIVGVGAIVWGPNNVTCRILYKKLTHQDDSIGGSSPPPHSLL